MRKVVVLIVVMHALHDLINWLSQTRRNDIHNLNPGLVIGPK